MARSSCETRTCWPRLPANDRAVRISSANERAKIPAAAGRIRTTSRNGGSGKANFGKPEGTELGSVGAPRHGKGQDRCGNERGDRSLRPDDQRLRRPEHRVEDGREKECVQAVHRG